MDSGVRNILSNKIAFGFLPILAITTALAQNFAYTGLVANWIAPTTGIYTITAFGAQGGGSYGGSGGLGAEMGGYFSLTAGDVLIIVVGGQGGNGEFFQNYGGGGGGGSFVYTTANLPLVIAGGGGGAAENSTDGLGNGGNG